MADGGLRTPRNRDPDPFTTLDELMVLVEALCPRWPEHEGFGPMHRNRGQTANFAGFIKTAEHLDRCPAGLR